MKTGVRFIATILATVLLQLFSLPMSVTALEALTDSSVQENQWEPAFASADAEVLFKTAKRETQEAFLADRTVASPGFHFVVGDNLDVDALYTHINNVQHGRKDTVTPAEASNDVTPSGTGNNDYWITYACAYVIINNEVIAHFYSFGYDDEFTDEDIQELLKFHTSEAYVNKWFTEFSNERVAQFPAETAEMAKTLGESVSAENEIEVAAESGQGLHAPISGISVSQAQTTGFKYGYYHPNSSTSVRLVVYKYTHKYVSYLEPVTSSTADEKYVTHFTETIIPGNTAAAYEDSELSFNSAYENVIAVTGVSTSYTVNRPAIDSMNSISPEASQSNIDGTSIIVGLGNHCSSFTIDVDGDSKIAMTPSVTASSASLNLVAKKKLFGASIPNMGKDAFSYCSMADCYTNGGLLDLTVTASVTYRFVNSSATTISDTLRIHYESAYYN